jgi:uncharacterized protein YkwD
MDPKSLALLTAFDALLLLVLLISLWAGWRRGLVAGAVELVALVASLSLAWAAGPSLADWAARQGWTLGVWALPAAVVLAYGLTRLLLGALLGSGLAAMPAQAHRHIGNRLLGLLPGAANGLIHMVLLLLLWQALPLGETLARSARDSVLARPLAPPAAWLQDRLATVFSPAWAEAMRRTTVQPGTRERLELPFRLQSAPARPDLETQMLALVNEVRRAHGLNPVSADPAATELARAHSRDMLAQGYFSHVSPQGQDPFERMRQGGLRFRAAGENLALAGDVAKAHQGLMDSPGHRANILRPTFGRLGIGIVDGGRHGLMVTQTFRN